MASVWFWCGHSLIVSTQNTKAILGSWVCHSLCAHQKDRLHCHGKPQHFEMYCYYCYRRQFYVS